jgi:hypothetical protein
VILLAVQFIEGIGVMAAIFLSLVGMVLHWQAPRHRMAVEERIKDGKITPDEAQRQMRFYARLAPLVTAMGILVLVLILFDMGE